MKDHLLSTFDYSLREYESMLELIKTRNSAGQEYYNAAQHLDAYKDKLLTLNDPTKWEIDFKEIKIRPDELAKNKMIAKSLMLPQQNLVMNEMKLIFGYFNSMMVSELTNLSNSRAKRYIRSLNNFCSEQVEIMEAVDNQSRSNRTYSQTCCTVYLPYSRVYQKCRRSQYESNKPRLYLTETRSF